LPPEQRGNRIKLFILYYSKFRSVHSKLQFRLTVQPASRLLGAGQHSRTSFYVRLQTDELLFLRQWLPSPHLETRWEISGGLADLGDQEGMMCSSSSGLGGVNFWIVTRIGIRKQVTPEERATLEVVYLAGLTPNCSIFDPEFASSCATKQKSVAVAFGLNRKSSILWSPEFFSPRPPSGGAV
jgi:hypothetical protein